MVRPPMWLAKLQPPSIPGYATLSKHNLTLRRLSPWESAGSSAECIDRCKPSSGTPPVKQKAATGEMRGPRFLNREPTYAAVVPAPALSVAGTFGRPPDTVSMQRLRASLSEDT